MTLLPKAAGASEESDFVELANGDLLWIHRADHYTTDGHLLYFGRTQTISKKVGDTFVSERPKILPWQHSGYPCLLMTREGTILELSHAGSHWSSDDGNTWHDLMVGTEPVWTHCYPRALQTDDGTIVVVSHRAGDYTWGVPDPYGAVDQAIIQETFRLSPSPK
jgi:hypothetical protein